MFLIKLEILCIAIFFILNSEYADASADLAITEAGKKYVIENKYEYTWFESLQECAKRNMTLVALDSAEKNNDLIKLLKNRFGKGLDLWIGATSTTAELNRKFVWSSTGKDFDYAHWQNAEPNNLGGHQICVHTWSVSPDFRWADGQWYLRYGYICEEKPITLVELDLMRRLQSVEGMLEDLIKDFEAKRTRLDDIDYARKLMVDDINSEFLSNLKKAKSTLNKNGI